MTRDYGSLLYMELMYDLPCYFISLSLLVTCLEICVGPRHH